MSIFDFLSFGSFEIEAGNLFYYIAASILLVVYLLSRFLVRSQLGLVLAGTRQNEKRLAFLGYRGPNIQSNCIYICRCHCRSRRSIVCPS